MAVFRTLHGSAFVLVELCLSRASRRTGVLSMAPVLLFLPCLCHNHHNHRDVPLKRRTVNVDRLERLIERVPIIVPPAAPDWAKGIRRAILARGLTNSGACLLLRVSTTTINKWVNGLSYPSEENWSRICSRLDVFREDVENGLTDMYATASGRFDS